MKLPEVPISWMQAFLLIALLILTGMGFNHFVQAAIGIGVGYLFGVEKEKIKKLVIEKQ